MKQSKLSTGIDIAADTFVVSIISEPGTALHGPQEFENNLEGYTELVAWFKQNNIKPKDMIICMESTGVYGEKLCYFLYHKKYRLAVEQAKKVKRAFKIDGHKTDPADSLQIAEYAFRYYDELHPWKPREEIVEKIKAMITSRELLVTHKTAMSNSLHALNRKAVRPSVAIRIMEKEKQALANAIKMLEKKMNKLTLIDPYVRQTVNNLKTLMGVQDLMALNMLVITNGFKSEKYYKQIASYLKIAPLRHESGTSVYKKPKSPKYGPRIIRKLLHLAARTVVTHDPVYKIYYLRKQKEGKPKQLVLNNVGNKLIKMMCAMIRDQKPFIKHYHSVHPELLKTA
ncbi:MAG: IS110 family transposase [Candidatus Marinimicrobia bacterium]|nr:IS110 family transposase [Candidatus Neomarinimicrobiota bacterium]